METINIVFASDNNYAKYTGVAICSIFENKKNQNKIDVYILDGGINENNKEKLNFLSEKYSFNLIFIDIKQSLFNNLPLKVKNITKAAYYKLIIPDILPNLNKILFLDGDLIVLGDLYELFNIEIKDYYLAAVAEEWDLVGVFKKLGIINGGKYFNTGVMLMNLSKMRKDNLSAQLINFAENNMEKITFAEQDVFNGLLWNDNKTLFLPIKYNYLYWFFETYPMKIKDIVIVHYAGQKPWNYTCDNKLKYLYFNYLKLSPWKGQKYIDKNIKTIIIKYRRLIFFNLRKVISFILPNFLLQNLLKLKRRLKIKFY